MAQAPGAQQDPVFNMIAGNLAVSFNGGVTYSLVTGPTSIPLATPSAAGLMSAAPSVAGIANVGEYDLVVDLTATGDRGVIVPAVPGFIFCVTRWSQLVLAITGTASGTAPTVSCGVSSAFTNVFAAAAAQTTGALNVGPGQLGNQSATGSNAALVSNSALHISCGTAVTGATVLSVKISLFGYWNAVAF